MWRPDNWKEMQIALLGCGDLCELTKTDTDCKECVHKLESIASAMLSALVKWLEEPCDKHIMGEHPCEIGFHAHRFHCDICMAELKESEKMSDRDLELVAKAGKVVGMLNVEKAYIQEVIPAKIKEAIAANNKWWIEKTEPHICSDCQYAGKNCVGCEFHWWQQIKKEVTE